MTELPAPPMATHVGYRLIKIGESLMDRAEHVLAPVDIKPRHFNVLVTLLNSEKLSQQALSRVLGIDVNAMVGVIDFLEDSGLAVRQRNPEDRRRHVITVTERGVDVIRQGSALVAEAEAEYFAPLSAAEQKQLQRLTAKLLRLDGE